MPPCCTATCFCARRRSSLARRRADHCGGDVRSVTASCRAANNAWHDCVLPGPRPALQGCWKAGSPLACGTGRQPTACGTTGSVIMQGRDTQHGNGNLRGFKIKCPDDCHSHFSFSLLVYPASATPTRPPLVYVPPVAAAMATAAASQPAQTARTPQVRGPSSLSLDSLRPALHQCCSLH